MQGAKKDGAETDEEARPILEKTKKNQNARLGNSPDQEWMAIMTWGHICAAKEGKEQMRETRAGMDRPWCQHINWSEVTEISLQRCEKRRHPMSYRNGSECKKKRGEWRHEGPPH